MVERRFEEPGVGSSSLSLDTGFSLTCWDGLLTVLARVRLMFTVRYEVPTNDRIAQLAEHRTTLRMGRGFESLSGHRFDTV